MGYHFSLIRFVPDPARGEFVNIGAIVGDDIAQDWSLRFISNFRRAKALDARGVLPAAVAFASGLDERIDAVDEPQIIGPEPVSVDFLDQLSAESQNIVQFTPPAPVASESADDALDLIFEHLILDPTQKQFRFDKKHRAQRAARTAYRDHDVPQEAVVERVRIESGAYDGTFDFAVHNGRAVQLVQCWSFQLPDQEQLAEQVKAWSWVVHEVREQGGALEASGHGVEVPGDTHIAAVCILPKEGEEAPAYEEAQAAFEENRVEELTPENADKLGADARQLLIPA